jgi:nicotinamide mononucleotide transporter
VPESLEAVAVALALAYLVLAIRENAWCWPAGMASTAIYLWVMSRAALYMEAALQVFYLGVSVYGWWRWRRSGPVLPITTWPVRAHLVALGAVTTLAAASGTWLAGHTDAALPFLDSWITWSSILTTWMVARKVLENWLYWLVIDSICIYVYISRDLLLTAALFAIYLLLAVAGFRAWRRRLGAVAA